MKFNKDQYVVKRLDDLETITITRGALCEWAGYYDREGANAESKMVRNYYAGRRDVLLDIIGHLSASEELNFTEGGLLNLLTSDDMATIEERAGAIYKGNTIEEDAYKRGASEQKAIDEAESGKELLYVAHKTTERVKKEVTEEACEWLCKTCEIGICPIEHKCHRYKGFRKAMMKE